MDPIRSEVIYNTAEAAKILGIDTRTMETWRLRGEGPKFLRYGRRSVRYRLQDLQAFMQASLVEPRSGSH